MGTLDYTVVYGSTVYVAGDEVPSDVVRSIEAGGAPSSDEAPEAPKTSDKKDVWLMYAVDRGIAVPDGATKEQVVDAVQAYHESVNPAPES